MTARESAPSILIRDAVLEDFEAIVRFNRELAWETEEKALDQGVLERGVRRALEVPGLLRYWMAEESGRVAGQAAVSREWSDWRDGWIWWFQSVYVDASHRKKGVFRALYGHIRNLAFSDPSVIGLRLYVEAENLPAQATYRSLGMSPGGYEVFEDLWINRSPAPRDPAPGLR